MGSLRWPFGRRHQASWFLKVSTVIDGLEAARHRAGSCFRGLLTTVGALIGRSNTIFDRER